jgi:DNA invertase Pin-like site-specific DNA recombinase
MSKTYIYSRVSTDKQETENQLHGLTKLYPTAEVVSETISGTKSTKPILEALLARLQPGDTLVIAALDRLGRRAGKAIQLIDDLYTKGIKVVSIREGLDYSTSSGKLIGQITLAVSENERNLISERTKAALASKKAQGVILGAPRRYDSSVVATVVLHRQQGLNLKQIAKLTGISQATVCRMLKVA